MSVLVPIGAVATCLFMGALRVTGQSILEPPDLGAWRFFSRGHADGIGMGYTGKNSTNILRITAFKDGSGVSISMNEQGLATVSVDDYNWANRGVFRTELGKTNLVKLQKLLGQLAEGSNSVPFWVTNMARLRVALPTNQLVMVSFREGTNWVQRQYSDGVLPRAVFECYDLLLPSNLTIHSLNRGR